MLASVSPDAGGKLPCGLSSVQGQGRSAPAKSMLNQNLSTPVRCFTTPAGVSSEGGTTASNARTSSSPATLFTTVVRRKSRNPVITSSSGASSAGRSLGTGATSRGGIATRYAAPWLVGLANRETLLTGT